MVLLTISDNMANFVAFKTPYFFSTIFVKMRISHLKHFLLTLLCSVLLGDISINALQAYFQNSLNTSSWLQKKCQTWEWLLFLMPVIVCTNVIRKTIKKNVNLTILFGALLTNPARQASHLNSLAKVSTCCPVYLIFNNFVNIDKVPSKMPFLAQFFITSALTGQLPSKFKHVIKHPLPNIMKENLTNLLFLQPILFS